MTVNVQKEIDDDELFNKLMEDLELLQELMNPLDIDSAMAGDQLPLFFGSAMCHVQFRCLAIFGYIL